MDFRENKMFKELAAEILQLTLSNEIIQSTLITTADRSDVINGNSNSRERHYILFVKMLYDRRYNYFDFLYQM